MIIKMNQARFCVDCEAVFDERECGRDMICPACSSHATWPLEPWLNPRLERWDPRIAAGGSHRQHLNPKG